MVVGSSVAVSDMSLCMRKNNNSGSDHAQHMCNCEADLRFCFRICRLLVFPCSGSYKTYQGIFSEPF